MAETWPDLLTGLIAGKDLSATSVAWAMGQILAGDATPVQIAGFAVAMRAKGETVAELGGMAGAMLDRATPISITSDAVDVVGSGGDRANTVNISTMAAIVTAGCGVPVVKHGNRAASSACGTADCLEALGVALAVPPQAQAQVLAQTGIVFLFAPLYHPSLRHAASARGELKVQTTFNFLGPLANPARPRAQAVGVANAQMAPLVAGVLADRGTRGLVFQGADGLDELTTTMESRLWLITDGRVVPAELDPLDLGIARAAAAELVGGPPATNARIVREVLAGAPGPVRDIVTLNAAAACLSFAGVSVEDPLVPQFASHLERARQSIDTGAAAGVLERWITASQAAVAG
ncbi:MAG: anthranilate phosphoribosyltransferase [Propionicimonas sp.]